MFCRYRKVNGVVERHIFETPDHPGWVDTPAKLDGWKPGTEIVLLRVLPPEVKPEPVEPVKRGPGRPRRV